MSELDYTLLNAIKQMAGETDTSTEVQVDVPTVTVDSTPIEVLDYILLFMCGRLNRVKNFYKGGYVLMKLLPKNTRYSYDIDFSIGSSEEYEIIKPVLNSLGDDLLSKGFITSFVVKEDIAPTRSGGIGLYRGEEKVLGIDIGWHDVSYGMTDWEISGLSLKRFTVERMLADKISAIYTPKRFRRVKDLYDVYILCNHFDVDYKFLSDCIKRRGTVDWTKDPFREEVLVQYSRAYDKLKIANPNANIDKPDFHDCINKLAHLVSNIER